ncbi:radical SAM protein, partial [Patescibacteria group bacterium]|nr:radical SAM protein [Patescibacteria group bacterium]
EIVINPRQKRIAELDNLPYPLRSKQDMETYKCGGIYYPTASLQRSTAQVVYSRGCPHLCPYCSSKNMWGTAVIYRDPVRVAEEIEYLIDSFGTNLIFFTDLTFNLNKKRVLDLCTVLIERNIKVSWFCACRTEGIDKELLSAMKEAGCTRIHFGVEAIDEHSLKKIKRKKTYESIQESLEKTSKIGIITRGYLMIGYPWETREHLESINKNLNQLYIDDLRMSFFTPYPGSDIYKQSVGKTMSIDWDNYTSDKPLYRLKGLTTSEILELRNRIFFGFYASSTYIDRLKEKLVNYPHLHDSFKEFVQELGVRVLLDVLKTSKREDSYRQTG